MFYTDGASKLISYLFALLVKLKVKNYSKEIFNNLFGTLYLQAKVFSNPQCSSSTRNRICSHVGHSEW
jgi:hypothetical protein